MRRDRRFSYGSGDEAETTERTSLVRHSSYLDSYPHFGSSSDRFTTALNHDVSGAILREENMQEHYRQVFTRPGISIGLRDVALVDRHYLHRCTLRVFPPRVVCESVTAHLGAGLLHAIVDVDGAAAVALLRAICGERTCDSGVLTLGGGLAGGKHFRRIIGVMGHTSAAVPSLTVARNLRFVLDMRTRGSHDWKCSMIQSVAAFTALDLRRKAAELLPADHFSLRLAMELLLDPPVIVAKYPFEGLDYASRLRAASLLKSVSTVLGKTVIVSSSSLGPYLFDASDTTILFGGSGHVLYSGPSRELVGYFNALRIPRHRLGPHESHGLAPDAEEHGRGTMELRPTPPPSPENEDDTGLGADGDAAQATAGSTHSRHALLATAAPPRISSRLFTDDGRTPVATLANAASRMSGPASSNVVIYSGDDALDLVVEWSESEAQTMYYAAKFYDSAVRQRLVVEVDALALPSTPSVADAGSRGGEGGSVLHLDKRQRALRKQVLLSLYLLHQFMADAEGLLSAAALFVILCTVSLMMHFQPADQGGMYNTRGMLFLLFSIVLTANQTNMYGISGQLRLFAHQRNSGMYGTGCFVLCLTFCITLMRSVYLVLLLPFFVSTVQASKGVVTLVGAVSVVHTFLLYALYAVVPSRRFAGWCAHAYFGFSLICSGFLLNLRTIPSIFGSMSIMRWGYGFALKEHLHGKQFSCDGADNTSYCYTGLEYLTLEGLADDMLSRSIGALALMGATFLVVLHAALAAH